MCQCESQPVLISQRSSASCAFSDISVHDSVREPFRMETCAYLKTNSGKKMTQSLRATQVRLACLTAEEFMNLYYKYLDKQKNMLSRMYMDDATLVWNGNCVAGKDNIQKFWIELPFSEHIINTLDAQPITGPEVEDQLTFLVKIGGQVKYNESVKMNQTLFNQTFLITAIDNKWKIVNDCFRTLDLLE